MTLRDRRQHQRHFAWKPGGFLLEGRPVTLRRPTVAPSSAPALTASGSVAAAPRPASVAAASRIWVEGRHDAELVEHVWGDDLRELAVVVEPMHGIDDLVAAVAEFAPTPARRLGVLVDHLVPGSKESRLAAAVDHPHVLVTGHPFVDVWAGVRPRVLGLDRWPDVPRGVPWKEGMCAALGTDPVTFWPRLRNRCAPTPTSAPSSSAPSNASSTSSPHPEPNGVLCRVLRAQRAQIRSEPLGSGISGAGWFGG